MVLVCLSLGMHWVLLQGVAWTGMFLSFASQGAVIEAVEKTFDGQHACPLCEKVKEGQDSGSGQPKQAGQSMKKMEAVLVNVETLVAPPSQLISFHVVPLSGTVRSEKPEMPPPRSVSV